MNLSALNNFDYLILSIVFISMLFGFMKGFIRSGLSLMGWVVSAYAAYVLFPTVKPFLLSHFPNEMVVNVGGPVAVFFVALIVVSVVTYQMVHALGEVCGGTIDRSMGLAFGLARGGLLVSAMYIGLTMIAPGLSTDKTKDTYHEQAMETEKFAPGWLRSAQTYNLLKLSSAVVLDMLPMDLADRLQRIIGEAKNKDSDRLPMSKMISIAEEMRALMPPEIHLNTKPLSASDAVSKKENEQRQKEVLRIVLETYKMLVKAKKIPADKAVSEGKVKLLEEALATPKPIMVQVKGKEKQNEDKNTGAAMPGYGKKQINELDRLMQTVQ